MKKIGFLLLALLVFSAVWCFAVNAVTGNITYLNEYASYFAENPPAAPGTVDIPMKYFLPMRKDDIYTKAAALSGNEAITDSVLEFAIASYYSPSVVSIRPAKAAELLPENSKNAGLKLAYAVLRELAEVKFLNTDTSTGSVSAAAVGRYDGMVKFIQDKHGLSRAEIDNYFRDSMRAEVKTVVDEEFNKIRFMVTRDYDAWLTYVPKTGQYILDYQGFMEDKQSITASSLTALASEMRKKSFDDAAINLVREQASQTPAAVYAQRHARGEADALELIIESVTNFFVNPSQDNYNTLLGIDARYSSSYSSTQTKASLAYSTALNRIWDGFGRRIAEEVNKDGGSNIHTYARYPNDPRYAVFGGR